MIHSSINGDIDLQGSVDVQGNVYIGHQIVHNYYVSTDWQDLEDRYQKTLKKAQQYPEDSDFWEELATLDKQRESFSAMC